MNEGEPEAAFVDVPSMVIVTAEKQDAELVRKGPREGVDSGEAIVSLRVLHASADGAMNAGVWECTPGGWEIVARSDTEVAYILSGRARLTERGGPAVEIGPGDTVVLPAGWSGRWDVLETVCKLYVVG